MEIAVKRVYDPPSENDGFRILVDRLWPRGMTKERLRADFWAKDTAPSTGLRKWYGGNPDNWDAFREKYVAELAANPAGVAALRAACEGRAAITLLYSVKSAEHNHAVVLRELLQQA